MDRIRQRFRWALRRTPPRSAGPTVRRKLELHLLTGRAARESYLTAGQRPRRAGCPARADKDQLYVARRNCSGEGRSTLAPALEYTGERRAQGAKTPSQAAKRPFGPEDCSLSARPCLKACFADPPQTSPDRGTSRREEGHRHPATD